MSKNERQENQAREEDPDSMGLFGKIAAFFLLLLFAVYLIFFSGL